MPIAPLPENTIQAIGSTSALSDACSVIKELLDNALDASAKSISVEISSNTLDIIQVKDNGCGILPTDREFVCRPNFTSKIRTLEDLTNVGGNSLGFRGAALAGIVEMSNEVMVTTRVDGEVVAAAVKYRRNGEILSNLKVSHARGTTVRVSNFLNNIPVRKQVALKTSSRTITNIKKMLQTYAIARPTVRLSFKVLKAKTDSGNWTYGPTPKATIVDAASKVAGADAASQCSLRTWPLEDAVEKGSDLVTISESENTSNVKLVAYLPNVEADFQKTSRFGQYIAVDGRPVSVSKGVPKYIIKSFKSHLRSLWERDGSQATFPDTFLCLHIHCPRGSYDVNIEPSKDEVLFENSGSILSATGSLFSHIYGHIADGKPEKENGKKRENIQPQANAFDVLLATKPSNPGSNLERRRPSGEESRTALHERTPRRCSQHSITDLTEMASTDLSMSSAPWAISKRGIAAPNNADNSHSNTSPSRPQQLLTPGRDKPAAPIRNSPARELCLPSFLPSPIQTQQPRAERSNSEATRVATNNNTGLENFDGSSKSDNCHRLPKLSGRGYGDEAIAMWVRESRIHLEDPVIMNEHKYDHSELGSGAEPSGSQGDVTSDMDIASRKPESNGGLGKQFKLPLKRSQVVLQPPGREDERDGKPAATEKDERGSMIDYGPSCSSYPGFERVSTLIRDRSKEAFASCFEATLDYERRKKALNQSTGHRPRSQSTLSFPDADPTQDSVIFFPPEPKNHPHKNRYHAAKAALAPREPVQYRGKGIKEPEARSGALKSDDPRTYYIRNREKIERPADTKSGHKIRRIETYRLPLESIPGKCSLHRLTSTCSVDHKLIPYLVDEFRTVDTYIRSGDIMSSSRRGFRELSQEESSHLNLQVRNLLRQEYRTADECSPADIPLNFKTL